ncbi:hypothetical protein [Kitasatospora sp. NPDC090091]
MNPQPPYRRPGSDDSPVSVRVWVAYGVSAAAGLHVVVAALVLINRAR